MKSLLHITVVLLLVASALAQQSGAPELYRDADAYEIYSQLLPDDWSWQGSRLLLAEATTMVSAPDAGQCFQLQGDQKKKFQEVFDDFTRVNRKAWILLPLLTIDKPYDIVAASQLSDSAGLNWKQQYPGAVSVVTFSAVGFNADRTQALVFINHQCGSQCSAGTYYLLQEKEGKWQPGRLRVGCAYQS